MFSLIFFVAAILGASYALRDYIGPIVAWDPQDMPRWLVLILKTIAIILVGAFVIIGVLSTIFIFSALSSGSKRD